jgi:hypothetical protein
MNTPLIMNKALPDKPEERFDYIHWREDWSPWENRGDKPFFGYFTLGMTHEGSAQIMSHWKRDVKDPLN